MTKIDNYYKILDLEPGDSSENIKQAHRDLAFIWHPDRCPQNSRIQHKAEEKLKAINEAYEYLSLYEVIMQATPVKTSKPQPECRNQPQPSSASYRQSETKRNPASAYRSSNYSNQPQDINVWLY